MPSPRRGKSWTRNAARSAGWSGSSRRRGRARERSRKRSRGELVDLVGTPSCAHGLHLTDLPRGPPCAASNTTSFSLNREVVTLTPLLAQTDALHETIDHLARLNAASEAEAQQLIAQNSELVGHSNQGQKIRHVAMIREELAESRKVRAGCCFVSVSFLRPGPLPSVPPPGRGHNFDLRVHFNQKHLATLSSLTAAQQKISNLEAELDTYRAVPASGGGVSRARVTRPVMDDAYSSTAIMPNSAPTVLVVPSASSAPSSASGAGATAAVPGTVTITGPDTAAGSLAPPSLAGAGVPRRASLARSGASSTLTVTAAAGEGARPAPLSSGITAVSVALADDLNPLLPPQLAKSQLASRTAGALAPPPLSLPDPTGRGARTGTKSVGAAVVARGGGRRVGGGARRESMGVKMEGRMSVSELF